MAVRYYIRLLNTSGAVVVVIDDWERLEITKTVNSQGDYRLELDGGSRNNGLISLFTLDSMLEFIRSDVAAGIAPYKEWEAFHRTSQRYQLQSGMERFASYGRGYNDLLWRREIAYPAGSSQANKTGAAETVMKAFVNQNAAASATAPPRLAAGVTTGLTVEADGGLGTSWTGSRSHRNLLEVLQEIAATGGVDFGVVGTGAAAFQFRTKLGQWGSDRTTTGLNPATGLNGAGNSPVIFSVLFGNMALPQYAMSRTQERNRIFVLGQGIESDRTVQVVNDATLQANSPWNLSEVSRNANLEATAAGLTAVGNEQLFQLAPRETLSFTVLQTLSHRYGRDYFLGDRITARYRSQEVNRKIKTVTLRLEAGKAEEITIGLDSEEG